MNDNLQLLLEALLTQPTPNTPQGLVEDKIRYEQHHLLMLLQQRLAGQPDASTMIEHYMEAPDIWEGVLVDALLKNNLTEDAEIQQAARAVVNYTDPLDPEETTGYIQ
jgi:hypothetical protein